jgi:heat shock protein HtpX
MIGFVFFVVGFVYLIGQLTDASGGIIVMAGLFSLVSSIGSYFWGDKIVLKLSNAKPASREDYFTYYTAAENLSLAAQIPLPKLYVIDSPAMNAFATGRDPEHAIVCVTTGLLNNLSRTELEGVIAHEISHITNYDIRLMTIVAVLVGMITILSDWLLRLGRIGLSDDDDSKANPITMAAGLIAVIISPIAAKLIQLALSRKREYLADATAVKLTRQPDGLINALKKLGQSRIPLKNANQATAHLFITNPLKNKRGFQKMASLFSTHPPLEDRINNLSQML